jgi:hypothetical protein
MRKPNWKEVGFASLLMLYGLGLGLMVCAYSGRAFCDSVVITLGPTLNGNTNPKMAGLGYEYTWGQGSLLPECRAIFSDPVNGACELVLSARVETHSGLFMRLGAGPAWYFREDDRVSSHFNFNLQGALGLTQNGWALGVVLIHYSNAGLVPPNLGRDYIGALVEIGI